MFQDHPDAGTKHDAGKAVVIRVPRALPVRMSDIEESPWGEARKRPVMNRRAVRVGTVDIDLPNYLAEILESLLRGPVKKGGKTMTSHIAALRIETKGICEIPHLRPGEREYRLVTK